MINSSLKRDLHLTGHFVKDFHHCAVISQYVRCESGKTVLARDLHKAFEQISANAKPLEVIMHGDCDFGIVAAWLPKVASHANHPFPSFMRHETYQGKVIAVIQGDEFLHLIV